MKKSSGSSSAKIMGTMPKHDLSIMAVNGSANMKGAQTISVEVNAALLKAMQKGNSMTSLSLVGVNGDAVMEGEGGVISVSAVSQAAQPNAPKTEEKPYRFRR